MKVDKRSSVIAAIEVVEPRQLLATFSSSVFNDLNTNGVRDSGEPGAAGHVMYGDYNYNGKRDAGEPSAVTDANGHYTLQANLQPFPLRIIPATGWQQLSPTEGESRSVIVRNGNELFSYNSTFSVANTAASTTVLVTGYVFYDPNGDQIRQDAEPSHENRRGGADYTATGAYLEITRPTRLVFTFTLLAFSPNTDTISVEIAPDGAGCVLTLTQQGVDLAAELACVPPGMKSGSELGWAKVFDTLAAALA